MSPKNLPLINIQLRSLKFGFARLLITQRALCRPCDENDLNQVFTFQDEEEGGRMKNVGTGMCFVADDDGKSGVMKVCNDDSPSVKYNNVTLQIIIDDGGDNCVDLDHGDNTKPLNVYPCHTDMNDPDLPHQQFRYIADTGLIQYSNPSSLGCLSTMPIPKFPDKELMFFESKKQNLMEVRCSE